MNRRYNLPKSMLLEAVMELAGLEGDTFGPRTFARAIGRPKIRCMKALKGYREYAEKQARQDLDKLVGEGILIRTTNKKDAIEYMPNPDKSIEDAYEHAA